MIHDQFKINAQFTKINYDAATNGIASYNYDGSKY